MKTAPAHRQAGIVLGRRRLLERTRIFGHMAAMSVDNHSRPRPIDHIVLPTAKLAVARARLSRLGFTVSPDGQHPFGTENACVYLADGTFLEPLAQANEKIQIEAAHRNNVFAARDLAYRFRRGEEGMSAIVFGTEDAEADHTVFMQEGISAGPVLEFSRNFVDAEGREDKASFRLAFAADLRAPDCFFFTCQRIGVPNVDRSTLERHENGAVRLKAAVLAAPDPFSFGPTVRAVSGAEIDGFHDNRFTIAAANAGIEMMTTQALYENFGTLSIDDRGLRARAVVFGVPDLKATKSYLVSKGIACEKYRGRVIVLPAPGQGAIFAFEAA